MAEVLELTKIEQPDIIIDDSIDDTIMFPEKLQAAKEFIEKNPLPAWVFLRKYSKTQQKEGICMSGVLERVDAETHTLMVVVTLNAYATSNYHIRTTPDTLNQLVKTYWRQTINVRIRPQINSDNQFEYELMEVN